MGWREDNLVRRTKMSPRARCLVIAEAEAFRVRDPGLEVSERVRCGSGDACHCRRELIRVQAPTSTATTLPLRVSTSSLAMWFHARHCAILSPQVPTSVSNRS